MCIIGRNFPYSMLVLVYTWRVNKKLKYSYQFPGIQETLNSFPILKTDPLNSPCYYAYPIMSDSLTS